MEKREMSAKGGSASGGETKEASKKCCAWFNAKHKKVFVIVGGVVLLAILILSIAVAGLKIHQERNGGNMLYGENNFSSRGQMMNRGKLNTVATTSNTDNQFVIPQDASKSGEIAITVNNLEAAKKAISDIAAKNDGSVYATLISYASNNVKNGSIVVQIPATNFDQVFGDLRKVGSQVVQEETQQIPPRNIYVTPMMGAAQGNVAPLATTIESASADASVSVSNPTTSKTTTDVKNQVAQTAVASPDIAIYPNPIQSPQLIQDKGYIRVVFVDYGSQIGNGAMMQKQNGYATQEIGDSFLVIIGIKLIFLVAMFGLLVVVFKRIFHKIRRRKENKKVVHIVKQMPKVQKRVVRIAKRK